jgi:hypothetical protein
MMEFIHVGRFCFFRSDTANNCYFTCPVGRDDAVYVSLSDKCLKNIPLAGLFATLFCPVAAMSIRTNPKFKLRLLSKPALISATALVTAGSVYVFISILNAAGSPVEATGKMMTTFTSNLSDSFSYLMTGYQWAGIAQRANLIQLDFPKFNQDWAAVHSTWFLNHLPVGLAMILFAVPSTIMCKLRGVFTNFKELKVSRAILWIAVPSAVLWGYTASGNAEISRQIIVWSLYFLAIFAILPLIYTNRLRHQKGTDGHSIVAYSGLTLLLISAIAMFITDFPVPLKVPAVHLVCDGMFLVLLSTLICAGGDRSILTKVASAGIPVVLLILYVTPPAKGFLTIPTSENNFVPIKITPLSNQSAARQKFLD